MRRLYITGYEHNGIRQYSVNLSKKKAKEFAETKKKQTGIKVVFTSYNDVYSKESMEMTLEFYRDLNKMLKQKAGMSEVIINDRSKDESQIET